MRMKRFVHFLNIGCLVVLLILYTATYTAVGLHKAFISWEEYKQYFTGIQKHGIKAAWKEKGIFYFYDKKGRLCKL